MARNVFHRDFTLVKAGLLAALMGVAIFAGKAPGATAATSHGPAQAEASETVRIVPAVVHVIGAECKDTPKAVDL